MSERVKPRAVPRPSVSQSKISRGNAWALAFVGAVVCTSCGVSDHTYMLEGRPFAENVVAAVTKDWSPDRLIEDADPKMLEVLPEAQVRDLVATCAREIGKVRNQETLIGSTGYGVGPLTGRYASYLIKLEGENRTANVRVNVRRNQGYWKVVGFWVELPTGAPYQATAPPQ